jgi:hypothetical protein
MACDATAGSAEMRCARARQLIAEEDGLRNTGQHRRMTVIDLGEPVRLGRARARRAS